MNTICMTTIHVPTILTELCDNIRTYGHERDTNILIIGDAKTPTETRDFCVKTQRESSVPIEYLGLADQSNALSDYPRLLALFPVNTPDRVILGCMLAYLQGCERVIALDDDNFPIPAYDFVGSHAVTGTKCGLPVKSDARGWYNVHQALEEVQGIPFYPRGFPWRYREKQPRVCSNGRAHKTAFLSHGANVSSSLSVTSNWYGEVSGKVLVNQGLVLGDPDIDAITRLANPINAVGMKSEYPAQFGLFPGTWSPFNFQNTSLSREMIPLYYRPRSTLRNADIWTSYLFNRLAQHFGDVITFGLPLVNQIRNEHNLWDDLAIEVVNNRATDEFVELVRNSPLTETSYLTAMGELICLGEQEAHRRYAQTDWNVLGQTEERKMIWEFFREYQAWLNVINEIAK